MLVSAASLLWVYWRTMFGRSEKPASAGRRDLSVRELASALPLVGLALWIGLHPAPLLARLEPTMARVIIRLDPGYAPAFEKIPGCGAGTAPAPSAPAGFTAIAPCDAPSESSRPPDGAGR
jgi:hypothetical protein